MTWLFPIESFKGVIPEAPHLGAFGVVRKFHTHEGVDLYAAEGTPVRAVEAGRVVSVGPFTGPTADSPWWHDTMYVMVEGESGVVCYGEITPCTDVYRLGDLVRPGGLLGYVKQVLKKDKGRPMSMLHLELYKHGTREPVAWPPGAPQPEALLDPTLPLQGARCMKGAMTLRRFELHRKEDKSGVSGIGVVAEGVQFSDGRAAIRWRTQFKSTALYDNVDEVVAVHGHGGSTELVWIDLVGG